MDEARSSDDRGAVPPKRYYLALVDPLLSRPKFWELRKTPLTISLLEDSGADIEIPWTDLGLEDIGQFWKDTWQLMHSFANLQSSFRRMAEQTPSERARATQRVPQEQLNPELERKPTHAFELAFLGGAWVANPVVPDELFCHPRPSVCGGSIPLVPNHSVLKFFSTGSRLFDGTRKCYIRLEDFCPAQYSDQETEFGDLRQRGSPQKPAIVLFLKLSNVSTIKLSFRFVLVDVTQCQQKTTDENEDEESPLLLLPHFILSKVVSFLDFEELHETLLATNASVMDALRGRVPWRALRLDRNLDSRRKSALASPSDVTELTCVDVLNPKTNDVLWHGWEVHMGGKKLNKLIVDDIKVLDGIALSPQISYFGLLNEKLSEIPDDLSSPNLRSLRAITSLSIIIARLSPPLLPARLLPIQDFTHLKNLQLKPCPEKAFWSQLPFEFLSRIENLSVMVMVDCDRTVPFHLFKNLRGLRVFPPPDVEDWTGWEANLREALRLPLLHTLILDSEPAFSGEVNGRILKNLLNAAPNIKHLRFFCRLAFDEAVAVQALQKVEYFHATCLEHLDPEIILELIGRVSFDFVLAKLCTVAEEYLQRFTAAAAAVGGRLSCIRAGKRADSSQVIEFEHPSKPRASHLNSFPFTPSDTTRFVYGD